MDLAMHTESFSTNYDETLPLHLAVSKNSITCTKSIINSKYNVNTQDSQGRTPLTLALSNPHEIKTLVIKSLLHAGADIYVIDNFNRSALKIVLHHPSLRIVKPDILEIFLHRVKISCENDTDLMAKRLHDVSCPLEDIVRMKNSQLTRRILSKYNYSIDARKPPLNYTALHVAVKNMDLENIKVLVEFGADVNAKDSRNQVPLSLYSCKAEDTEENLEIVKFLMDKGTRLAQSYTKGPKEKDCASIFSLFKYGSKKLLRLLFNYDIDLSAKDHIGYTPIHMLAQNKNPGAIEVLKYKNFNIDVVAGSKETPLMFAMAAGNVKNVKFLIRSGANVNHEDILEVTPLISIYFDLHARKGERRNSYESCVEFLLQSGADPQKVTEVPSNTGNNMKTIFTFMTAFKNPNITRTILAHFAKLDVLNVPIKDVIRDQINSCQNKKLKFDLYKRELENMKKMRVYRSLTMFELLFDDMKFAENFRRHTMIIAKLTSARKEKFPDSYVHRQLKKRIALVTRKLKMRVIASAFVTKALRLPSNDHIVTQKMMNYLNYDDYKNLVKVYCKYEK